MSWTEEKVNKLKELWGKGNTASEIANIIGGISRNAVIGKAHRLNLAAKIKTRSHYSHKKNKNVDQNLNIQRKNRRSKFRTLLLDKDFEPAKNLSLEELTENTCKYGQGHPDEENFSFCGRNVVEKYSYCPLHMLMVWQTRDRKEELITKEDEVPHFIEKKIKSA
tara:strand:- start:1093 stop:1587 length:495 start_codon:yes stop_codon:yes gene_type:complete